MTVKALYTAFRLPSRTHMTSPFDGSQLKPATDHVFLDSSGGYLITNPAAVRRRFETTGRESNTREIKLENLGVFPLSRDALPILQKELVHDGVKLSILPLLKKSQIPLFSSADAQLVYIPPAGCAICRYFHELWTNDAEQDKAVDPVLSGFAVLASYAGL
ncbi:MAG: hypothetical protein OHK0011_24870 [Turneriella sp.]